MEKWVSFWDNVPDDCGPALRELKRLKVFKCAIWFSEETFEHIWWTVRHEVDLYVCGEFCREKKRSRYGCGEPEAMNLEQAKKADQWLIRWNDLARKYGTDETDEYYGQL